MRVCAQRVDGAGNSVVEFSTARRHCLACAEREVYRYGSEVASRTVARTRVLQRVACNRTENEVGAAAKKAGGMLPNAGLPILR